jgi:Tol biopolymer transport system component
VLFEMLTGRRLFSGETVSDVLAAVLRHDIDWKGLPDATPSRTRRLIERCLDRDPKLRLRDIGEARVALSGSADPGVAPAERSSRKAGIVVVAAAGLLAIGVVLGRASRPAASPPAPETRLSILPPAHGLAGDVDPAVSPDGRTIAFVAPGPSRAPVVWVRDLSSPAQRALGGTEGARQPFWSPDGKWIGFFAGGKLKKIPLAGGSPEVLADAPTARGGTWNARGDILFTPTSFVPIHRTTAGGSPVKQLVLSGEAPGPIAERRAYPHFLPDGRHFLFSRAFSIVVGDLESQEVREILPVASMAQYANGFLYYVRDGDLYAQPFDPVRFAVLGEPSKLADNVGWAGDTPTGFAFSVSPSGVVAFSDRNRSDLSQLAWFDRSGRRLGTLGEPAEYLGIALSPDEQRVAVEVHEPKGGTVSVWLIDARTGVSSRFARYKNWTGVPQWSADSRRLLVTDFTDRWHVLPIEGGPEQEIPVGAGVKWPTSWSRDGRYIVFTENRETPDIGLLDVASGTLRRFMETPFVEGQPRLSPDGAWLAYHSNETGRSEAYVQSFPNPGRKIRVSTSGGINAAWRPDGRAVFYLAENGDLVETELALAAGQLEMRASRTLLRAPPTSFALTERRTFEVSKDGQRFLFNSVLPDASPRAVSVILGWRPQAR